MNGAVSPPRLSSFTSAASSHEDFAAEDELEYSGDGIREPSRQPSVKNAYLQPKKPAGRVLHSKTRDTRKPTEVGSISEGSSKQDLLGKSRSDYELINLIGDGSLGKVYEARRISTGEYVAIKMIKKSRVLRDETVCGMIRDEIRILTNPKIIANPYIIKLKLSFQDKAFLYYIFELIREPNLKKLILRLNQLRDERNKEDSYLRLPDSLSDSRSDSRGLPPPDARFEADPGRGAKDRPYNRELKEVSRDFGREALYSGRDSSGRDSSGRDSSAREREFGVVARVMSDGGREFGRVEPGCVTSRDPVRRESYREWGGRESVRESVREGVHGRNLRSLIPLELIRLWMSELFYVIYTLNLEGIIHRDIKPDNILLKNGHIKLIDFNNSCIIPNGSPPPLAYSKLNRALNSVVEDHTPASFAPKAYPAKVSARQEQYLPSASYVTPSSRENATHEVPANPVNSAERGSTGGLQMGGSSFRKGLYNGAVNTAGPSPADTQGYGSNISLEDPDSSIIDVGMLGRACGGTLPWWAPERVAAILGRGPLNQRTQSDGRVFGIEYDIWSVGCVMYELMTGIHPFLKSTPEETCDRILKYSSKQIPLDFPVTVGPLARDLCLKLLEPNPQKRVQILSTNYADLLAHPFFAGFNFRSPLATIDASELINDLFKTGGSDPEHKSTEKHQPVSASMLEFTPEIGQAFRCREATELDAYDNMDGKISPFRQNRRPDVRTAVVPEEGEDDSDDFVGPTFPLTQKITPATLQAREERGSDIASPLAARRADMNPSTSRASTDGRMSVPDAAKSLPPRQGKSISHGGGRNPSGDISTTDRRGDRSDSGTSALRPESGTSGGRRESGWDASKIEETPLTRQDEKQEEERTPAWALEMSTEDFREFMITHLLATMGKILKGAAPQEEEEENDVLTMAEILTWGPVKVLQSVKKSQRRVIVPTQQLSIELAETDVGRRREPSRLREIRSSYDVRRSIDGALSIEGQRSHDGRSFDGRSRDGYRSGNESGHRQRNFEVKRHQEEGKRPYEEGRRPLDKRRANQRYQEEDEDSPQRMREFEEPASGILCCVRSPGYLMYNRIRRWLTPVNTPHDGRSTISSPLVEEDELLEIGRLADGYPGEGIRNLHVYSRSISQQHHRADGRNDIYARTDRPVSKADLLDKPSGIDRSMLERGGGVERGGGLERAGSFRSGEMMEKARHSSTEMNRTLGEDTPMVCYGVLSGRLGLLLFLVDKEKSVCTLQYIVEIYKQPFKIVVGLKEPPKTGKRLKPWEANEGRKRPDDRRWQEDRKWADERRQLDDGRPSEDGRRLEDRRRVEDRRQGEQRRQSERRWVDERRWEKRWEDCSEKDQSNESEEGTMDSDKNCITIIFESPATVVHYFQASRRRSETSGKRSDNQSTGPHRSDPRFDPHFRGDSHRSEPHRAENMEHRNHVIQSLWMQLPNLSSQQAWIRALEQAK